MNIKNINTYIKNFLKYRCLLVEFIKRDIKIKYRNSIIGVLWSIIRPLFIMMILYCVFKHIFKFNIENYGIYILTGQLSFNFFSEVTNASLYLILNNAPLLKKVYIPKYLLVVASILSGVINLIASYIAIILILLFTKSDLHYYILLSSVPLTLLIGFSLGISLILSSISSKFRDVSYLWGIFVVGLTYLTPIIYPLNLLDGHFIKKIVLINPMTNYIEMFRCCIMNNKCFSLNSFFIGLVESIIIIIIGLYVFYIRQDKFVLEV